MFDDSKPNQLTPAICTEWPAVSTIWLPDVLSQPESIGVPPAPGVPSTTEVLEMLRPGRGGGGGGGATSSLMMVPIAVPSAILAPLGEARLSVSGSLLSSVPSPATCTCTISVV